MVSILIINFNTEHHLLECVKSLGQHTAKAEYEVVVINNGEPMDAALFGNTGLDLRVINNARNIGYGAALNQGARLSNNDHVLCLNADTRLPDGSVEAMSGWLNDHPETGVVAPRLCYPDGGLQYSCRRNYTCSSILGRRLPFGALPMVEPALRHHLMLDEDHDKVLKPDWVQGSCLMIPRPTYENLGGFDERFFLYFEDYDLCNRVRRQQLDVVYLPEAEITHYYARSSATFNLFQREMWHHLGSAIRYYRKEPRQPEAAEPAGQPASPRS